MKLPQLIELLWAELGEIQEVSTYRITSMASARISDIASVVYLTPEDRELSVKTFIGMWKSTRNIP